MKATKGPNKVVWCNQGWLPAYYGFVPSEKAWKKALKRLDIASEPYPTTDARCTSFKNHKTGKLVVLVTVADHITPEHDPVGIIGLLVHEAMHVWRFIREDIGEHAPSAEFEAYAMQHISMELMQAFATTRGIKPAI